eukprot:CAMPEP_0170296650 /NCGR_PEP_ID=MMETSP0116_2-20130129/48475_1 /TAXON_ID=400756 /ORGANISM="Durinskia baltica, Strain CSIRO CS-38" /LENGTH=54 /DNA_ID=CAMNT_0010548253 /DNA_START=204 /DNA_END=365 /DNA_ORIENTATION=+
MSASTVAIVARGAKLRARVKPVHMALALEADLPGSTGGCRHRRTLTRTLQPGDK